MNVKQAKELRRQLIPVKLLQQAKEETGKRMSRGALMRSTTQLEAKPVTKTTEFKGRLWWLVQETLAGLFPIGQLLVRGGHKSDALKKAKKSSKWLSGTFFEAVEVKAGFNIGKLTPASFRAIYKKAKGVLNGVS
jgi:hypothetical protein